LEGNKEADDAAFLHQFLSKKMWKDPTSNNSAMHLDDDEIEDDEDEKAFDEAERFESKYNFRFEELQDNAKDELDENDIAGRMLFQQSRNQVVGHARNVADSVRRVDDKRKQQRETRKEKKEKEKRQKEAELKRLKNLKKQELQGRLAKISEMGGLKELGIDENFLDEDWDPEKYEVL
jgi:protein KRI1